MSLLGRAHERYVSQRRTQVLARRVAELVPRGARVLDVGCGGGEITRSILDASPDLQIEGIDVLIRPVSRVPVTQFDGVSIPFADGSFDVVMFVDVLHHTNDPMVLLDEARRVARRAIVIKDHLRDGVLANATLRFMDWAGNARHGVALPYVYWPQARWRAAFRELDLDVAAWNTKLELYPWPFSALFDRELHFVARLTPARAA